MHLSRNAARALNFAVIAVLFLLVGALLDTVSPLIAFVLAIVQIFVFIFIDRFFRVESKTKARQILKCVFAAIGIFAVTAVVVGVLQNNNYSVYTYGDTESAASFLSAAADTTHRIVYAFIQLLPILMYLSLVFDKVFFFPAASLYALLCTLANNTAKAFGPFSEYNGIVREYLVENFSNSVVAALFMLLITAVIVSVVDFFIHRPKKRHMTRYVLVWASLALAVVFTLLTVIFSISGTSFNIDAVKKSHHTAAYIFNSVVML